MGYDISVVIPVYEAEGCLQELYSRLKKSLDKITVNYEIIMVEDDSRDGSWQVIAGLAGGDKRLKAIRLSRNFGQHYAITAGLDCCDGDWVAVMDCDLQDRPEDIPRFYEKAKEGYDIVVGLREKRPKPQIRFFCSRLFYRVFNYCTDMEYDGRYGNFRLMSRKVVDSFRMMRENLRFFPVLVKWMGFSVATVDIQRDGRFCGKTSYDLNRLLTLGWDTIIAYSDKPLRVIVKLGFAMSFLAFLYGAFTFFRALFFGIPVEGWASIMVSLYLIGGMIIAILGVIGIYIGKTFDEAKKRPLYIIRDRINDGVIQR